MIKNSRLLITGGSGFIGAHLASQLVEDNEVLVLDRNHPTNSSLEMLGIIDHKNLNFYSSDITNISCSEIFDKIGTVDYIIHAAGVLGIQKVAEMPMQTMEVNGIGTFNMLKLALMQKKIKRFLYFSTSEIYGSQTSKMSETMDAHISTVGIRWNYATSKLFGEYLVKAAQVEHGLPGTIVRPFNVYGPYRLGSNAMTTLIRNALENKKIMISGDGSQKRSWCYIQDFIQGIILSMCSASSVGESFNIGNDTPNITMYDLACKIVKILHSHSEILITGNKIEDVLQRQPDISKTKRLLNYDPCVGLEEGILKTASSLSFQRQENVD